MKNEALVFIPNAKDYISVHCRAIFGETAVR
jgi:hypothetical protein